MVLQAGRITRPCYSSSRELRELSLNADPFAGGRDDVCAYASYAHMSVVSADLSALITVHIGCLCAFVHASIPDGYPAVWTFACGKPWVRAAFPNPAWFCSSGGYLDLRSLGLG